jgi:serine/threonine protein kinase
MADHQFELGHTGPRRLGDYIVHGLLGEGGMARVYAAEELLSRRPVALKILRAEFGSSEHGRQQFLTEMSILANLDDPRIVRCLACTQIDQQLVMVLEKLEGQNLREILKARGPLPWPEVASIVWQIARALVTAHSQRPPIVHRDLKPENVMYLADGRIKVMDFGIARILETIAGSTTHSGTPDYMSPEQIDALPIDGRSDLFALGLLAWEMLAGRRPFASDSPRAQLEQVCTAPTPALPEHVRAGLPPVLEQLIGWLLAKQPADRPRSAEEVVSLLEPLVRSSPAPQPTWAPPPPLTPPLTPPFAAVAPASQPSFSTMSIVEAARPRSASARRPRAIALGAAALAAVVGLALVARWAMGTADEEDAVVQPKAPSASGAAPAKDVVAGGVDVPSVEREDCSKLAGQFAMTTEVLFAASESAVGVNGFYTVGIVATPRGDGCALTLDVAKLGFGKQTSAGRGDFKKHSSKSGSGSLDWLAATREWAGHFEVSSPDGTVEYAMSVAKVEDELVGVWRNVGVGWETAKMSGRVRMWRGAQSMQPLEGPATNPCLWDCLQICHIIPDGPGRAKLSACVDECEPKRPDRFPSNCPL